MDKERCALITGAVRNTGLAVARKFLKEGWTVFITSRSGKEAKQKAAELSAQFSRPCYGLEYSPRDAADRIEILFSEIAAKGCTVNAVVCAAANLGLAQNSLTCEAEDWEDVFFTNMTGYFAPAKTAVREMLRQGKTEGGTVVFIGSINFRNCIPDRSAYVASKGGILSLTKALAVDFAQYGVRVNCIMPGPIWTSRYDADPAKAERKAEPIPYGRVSSAEEIANAVYYFSTEESGTATGTGFIIDGGLDSIYAGYRLKNKT